MIDLDNVWTLKCNTCGLIRMYDGINMAQMGMSHICPCGSSFWTMDEMDVRQWIRSNFVLGDIVRKSEVNDDLLKYLIKLMDLNDDPEQT